MLRGMDVFQATVLPALFLKESVGEEAGLTFFEAGAILLLSTTVLILLLQLQDYYSSKNGDVKRAVSKNGMTSSFHEFSRGSLVTSYAGGLSLFYINGRALADAYRHVFLTNPPVIDSSPWLLILAFVIFIPLFKNPDEKPLSIGRFSLDYGRLYATSAVLVALTAVTLISVILMRVL